MATLRNQRKMSRSERIISRLWCRAVSLGLAPSSWPGRPRIGPVALEVVGKRSGVKRRVAVTWIELNGERYLVSMLGEESDWVHNVRAAGGKVRLRRGKSRKVHLEELPAAARAPILQAWLGRTGVSKVPLKYLALDRHAPLEEFERIALRWPVFRISSVK
jgi:deazaflavin-dependent oxidoreductase (nitroreductase family)